MTTKIRQYAIDCLKEESESILELIPHLTEDFDNAVKLILHCKGKFIITGVGKSGHMGAKIAATLASTGTPSFFINPLDAYHGDLGMIDSKDIIMAISYSGQTDELLRLIPSLKARNIPIIAMTSNPQSLLAQNALYHLNIGVKKEACPLNLAPTSSTTTTVALGDAMACALIRLRKFKASDFAQFHPGGSLGKKLLTKVTNVMRTENLPIITPQMKLSEVIIVISDGKLGQAIVIDNNDQHIIGLITDGDIRRAMIKHGKDFFDIEAREIMNTHPYIVDKESKLTDAEELFKQHNLHTLLVSDNGKLSGILSSKDCII